MKCTVLMISTPPVDLSQFVQLACIISASSANSTPAIYHTICSTNARGPMLQGIVLKATKFFYVQPMSTEKIFRYDLDMRIHMFS